MISLGAEYFYKSLAKRCAELMYMMCCLVLDRCTTVSLAEHVRVVGNDDKGAENR